MADLEELAGRLEHLAAQVRRATAEEDLSIEGRALAVAMIVTLKLDLLDDAATALRTQGNPNG